MFNLFKKRESSQQLVENTHHHLISFARNEFFFTKLGVLDTLEGRLDMVIIHLFLAIEHLERLPEPAPSFAQELMDFAFVSFDRGLREAGVGDTTVPKRMKKLAAIYVGRSKAYKDAAENKNDLAQALLRNVYGLGSSLENKAEALADYMINSRAQIAPQSFESILQDGFHFARLS